MRLLPTSRIGLRPPEPGARVSSGRRRRSCPGSKTPPAAPPTDRTSSLYSYVGCIVSETRQTFQSVGSSRGDDRNSTDQANVEAKIEPDPNRGPPCRHGEGSAAMARARHARSPSDKPSSRVSTRNRPPRMQERHRMARRGRRALPVSAAANAIGQPLSWRRMTISVTLTAHMRASGIEFAKELSSRLVEHGGDDHRRIEDMPRNSIAACARVPSFRDAVIDLARPGLSKVLADHSARSERCGIAGYDEFRRSTARARKRHCAGSMPLPEQAFGNSSDSSSAPLPGCPVRYFDGPLGRAIGKSAEGRFRRRRPTKGLGRLLRQHVATSGNGNIEKSRDAGAANLLSA